MVEDERRTRGGREEEVRVRELYLYRTDYKMVEDERRTRGGREEEVRVRELYLYRTDYKMVEDERERLSRDNPTQTIIRTKKSQKKMEQYLYVLSIDDNIVSCHKTREKANEEQQRKRKGRVYIEEISHISPEIVDDMLATFRKKHPFLYLGIPVYMAGDHELDITLGEYFLTSTEAFERPIDNDCRFVVVRRRPTLLIEDSILLKIKL
jgi:hypothetical protein